MVDYCVNRSEQLNGDHEVHERGCVHWPEPQNVQLLGAFTDCIGAVAAARTYFGQVNGCKACARPCHTQ